MSDSLGDRMKAYEDCTRLYLPRRLPVVIRLDGKAFHTWTRGLERPYSYGLMSVMDEVTKHLCANVQNTVMAYTQSDEISLLLVNYKTIDTSAFNTRIADELTLKVKNPRAEVMTLHKLGFAAVRRYWNRVDVDKKGERGWKLAKQANPTAPDAITKLAQRLASLAKGAAPFGTVQDLVELAYEYELTPDEEWAEEGWDTVAVAQTAHKAMDLACIHDGKLDFDDMCFVPVRNNWIRAVYDLVVIDERQDMNKIQEIISIRSCKPTGRICVVGDRHQCIYGFRGADPKSMDKFKAELNAGELPLSITYRCPKTVVAEAVKLVPGYEAAPSAPEGSVTTTTADKMVETAAIGDFILSRKNAPLARFCMKFLRQGKRARIEGKDIGASLLSIIKKTGGKTLVEFLERLNKLEAKQIDIIKAKAKPGTDDHTAALIEQVTDKTETLRVLSEELTSIEELKTRISTLFDNTAASGGFIVLSSVHKAKGLEADRVFLLEDTFRETDEEEKNIKYVAITRAKRDLVWVPGTEKKNEEE